MATSSRSPTVALVVAVARNGVIGRDGGLPWRISSDLRTFRRLTMGKPLIMGRRTFDSLKKPLDGRDNIVVTSDPGFTVPGVIRTATLDEAIAKATACAHDRGADEIMVIGGAAIYRALLPRAHRIYWTAVDGEPSGDTHFPPLPAEQWRLRSSEPIPPRDGDEFSCELRLYERG